MTSSGFARVQLFAGEVRGQLHVIRVELGSGPQIPQRVPE